MKNLTPKDKDKGSTSGSFSSSSSNVPKISIKIPEYKGETNENVVVWLRQVKNIFHAQGIKDEGIMVHYAATGFKEAALHWFVNKVNSSQTDPFPDWDTFKKELKGAFQLPNY